MTLVVDGESHRYCSTACLLEAVADPDAPPALPLGLKPRDVKILELVASGYQNRQIGGQLYLSESSIKNRMGQLMELLRVEDRTQAVLAAHAAGIINLHVLAKRFARGRPQSPRKPGGIRA